MKKNVLLTIVCTLLALNTFAQGVFVSQNCDPQYNYAADRFAELCNSSDVAVDLTGWTLENVQGGAVTFTWTLSGTIEAGAVLVCGNVDTTAQTITPDVTATWEGNSWNGKGGDGVILKDASGTVVDNAVQDDATGKFENAQMVRLPNVLSPNATYDATEWTFVSKGDVQNATDSIATVGTHFFEQPTLSVFISQNCDPQYNYAADRFAELYNSSDVAVDVTGWTLENVQGGAVTFTWTLSGSIESGAALVCGNVDTTAQTITPDVTATWEGNSWNGKGGDGTILRNALGDTIDYAVQDDATGKFENAQMVRVKNVVAPSAVYDATEWEFASKGDIANATDENATVGTHICVLPAVSEPTIISSTTELGEFAYFEGNATVVKEFTVSASALLADLTVATTSNFELSLDASAYSSTLTLTQEAGAVADVTVYARLKADLAVGTYTEDSIILSSTDAISSVVSFTAKVNAKTVALPYTEDFESNSILFGAFTNNNLATDAYLLWVDKTYDGNTYAQMGSYGSTAASEDVWLVTPGIVTEGKATELSFDVAVGYWNHEGLTVKVSTDYDMTTEGVATATWTDISASFTFPQEPTSGYGTLTTVGTADLSAYTGTINVAFVYAGNAGAGQTSTYQIDNISVTENNEPSAISDVVDMTSVYGSKGLINVNTVGSEYVTVYDFTGRIHCTQLINGNSTISMKAGVYIVKVGSEVVKVAVQ